MDANKPVIDNVSSYLRLVNLSKFYEEGGHQRVVLQKSSFEVARGEVVAILGKSGSGKTTLLNLISGIDEADAGEIYLGGQNLIGMSETERTLVRRKNIGFVFQFFNLIPTLTVWENLILPLELNEMTSPIDYERAHVLLGEVGLTGREKAFPDRLSGGEQQRIAIARALVHDPQLLLADEPTGNLDEETGQHVLDLFDRLIRKMGKSVVMVTHSSDAAAYADRALLLREGHLSDYTVTA